MLGTQTPMNSFQAMLFGLGPFALFVVALLVCVTSALRRIAACPERTHTDRS